MFGDKKPGCGTYILIGLAVVAVVVIGIAVIIFRFLESQVHGGGGGTVGFLFILAFVLVACFGWIGGFIGSLFGVSK